MTHAYSDLNPGDALYKAARSYPGGIEALAGRMGMSSKVLYKKLGPNVDSHHVNYEEVSVIIDYLREAGKDDMVDLIINSFCWRSDYMAFELPKDFVSDAQLFNQVLEIMRHNGELANSLNEAMLDGHITSKEYQKLDEDIRTCMLGLLKLRKKIHVKHMESE